MFEALLDHHDDDDDYDRDPLVAQPPAAAAASAVPAPAQRRAQRGGVAQHSDATRSRLKLAWAKRKPNTCTRTLERISNGNLQVSANMWQQSHSVISPLKIER